MKKLKMAKLTNITLNFLMFHIMSKEKVFSIKKFFEIYLLF